MPRHPRGATNVQGLIDHEYHAHMNVAVDAIKRDLDALEAKGFKTKSECDKACQDAQRSIPKKFFNELRKSKKNG